MMAMSMLVVWAGYAVGLWGFCILMGYNVTFANIVSWNYPCQIATGRNC
jgi:hypothetical protein